MFARNDCVPCLITLQVVVLNLIISQPSIKYGDSAKQLRLLGSPITFTELAQPTLLIRNKYMQKLSLIKHLDRKMHADLIYFSVLIEAPLVFLLTTIELETQG